MSMVVRRRRRAPGDGDEEDGHDDQGDHHVQDGQLEEGQLALEDGEEGGRLWKALRARRLH